MLPDRVALVDGACHSDDELQFHCASVLVESEIEFRKQWSLLKSLMTFK